MRIGRSDLQADVGSVTTYLGATTRSLSPGPAPVLESDQAPSEFHCDRSGVCDQCPGACCRH